MTRPRPNISVAHLRRPTLDTKFHIDYDWWSQSDLDIKSFLSSRLGDVEDTQLDPDLEAVDLVDAETGEVRRVDGFQYLLQLYFNRMQDDFIKRTSLVDAVFYVLLANANKPMSARELAKRVDRDAETVLKTIGGSHIYQGIRPLFEETS